MGAQSAAKGREAGYRLKSCSKAWWGGEGTTVCTSRRSPRHCGARKIFAQLPGGTKKKEVLRVKRRFFGGADMADRQVSDGRGKVLKRGTHGYGLVGGDAV